MMGYVKHGLYTIGGECQFNSSNLLKMKSKDLEKIRGRKINDSAKCRSSIDTKLKDRLSN